MKYVNIIHGSGDRGCNKAKILGYLVTLFIIIGFFSGNAFAATYYMPDNFPNLQAAFAGMQGGDTLIIRDGVYTGEMNAINNNLYPPYGRSDAWTTIKAEHDGEVVFQEVGLWYNGWRDVGDGMTNLYWHFEGIIWGPLGVQILNARYVKFLKCGSYDAGDGNVGNFTAGRNVEYFLFENCYAWGNGRCKFGAYQSKHIIFRQCVGRLDREDPQYDPIYIFGMYSVDDGEVQNCIAVDSDQSQAWLNYDILAGAFVVPSTDMGAHRINFVNCIGLNNRLGGIHTTGNEYMRSEDVNYTNCIIWDSDTVNGQPVNYARGLRTNIINCTFGYARNINTPYMLSWDGIGFDNDTLIKNSIFYSIHGIQGNNDVAVLHDVETENYNSLYDNSINYAWTTQGANTKLDINPIWNGVSNPDGSLKYIVKVENDSNLSGQGENGTNIGATCLKIIGRPGTLWGETGYNEEQVENMWPFPYEALIRTKMKAYDAGGVSGNRGFCADGKQLNGIDDITLTSYIWEYLGNIYPDGPSQLVFSTTSLPHGIVNFQYSQTLSATGGVTPYTWSVISGNLPSGLTLNPSTGQISGMPTAQGTYPFTAEVRDNNGITATGLLSIVVEEAAQRHVLPGGSIQAAIDAAVDTDVIIVHEGTYVERINFQGKAITVRSTDPTNTCVVAATIIDGGYAGTVVTFNNGEGNGSVLSGITVQNGMADEGGGISCTFSSSPTITNCAIQGNSAAYGGGIYSHDSSPTINGCTIIENSAYYGYDSGDGGGIMCTSSDYPSPSFSPNITNCTIRANTASHDAGGISCDSYSSPIIANCTIEGNSATWGGGIRICCSSSPVIENCTIQENSASWAGGGMSFFTYGSCSPTITNCIIQGNSTGTYGGGILSYHSSPTITGCTIIENTSQDEGGGIAMMGGTDAIVMNCLIIHNTANDSGGLIAGGGIQIVEYSHALIINSTICDNSSATQNGGGIAMGGSSADITNCIIRRNTGGQLFEYGASFNTTYSDIEGGWSGTGNIDADPLFLNPAADDYHLASGSPCIDTGTGNGAPSTDMEGNSRPCGTGYDMGAYESCTTTLLCVDLPLNQGWNLISIPVSPDNPTAANLFPDAVVLYEFDPLYGYLPLEADSTLEVGRGYWINVSEARTYQICGQEVLSHSEELLQGWSLIGGISWLCNIQSTPGDIVVLYSFDPSLGYIPVGPALNLIPGLGYWINLTQPSTITMECPH